MTDSISIFWFRRDLRLEDNVALGKALSEEGKVLPIFIFDDEIIGELPENDPRVSFIYSNLKKINENLINVDSSLICFKGNPINVLKSIITKYNVKKVFFNKDYEPYSSMRDQRVKELLNSYGISCNSFKDQVVFEEREILKDDNSPYKVFSAYKNRWLESYKTIELEVNEELRFENFFKCNEPFPSLKSFGFVTSLIKVPEFDLAIIEDYQKFRDYPWMNGTSYLSTHLRFGTISIRKIVRSLDVDCAFLSELIWREFYMQILFNFPHVVTSNFKEKYNGITWRNNSDEFKAWCEGKTGYPLVDAGMKELNATGLMHNRVRMVVASFLCKHLLIDWRWGEAYFASKLLDFDLASNNGNWQWVSGTGCDSAPYFRIFNPEAQHRKFDKDSRYTSKWNPRWELQTITPIVDHTYARKRALETYKLGLNS